MKNELLTCASIMVLRRVISSDVLNLVMVLRRVISTDIVNLLGDGVEENDDVEESDLLRCSESGICTVGWKAN